MFSDLRVTDDVLKATSEADVSMVNESSGDPSHQTLTCFWEVCSAVFFYMTHVIKLTNQKPGRQSECEETTQRVHSADYLDSVSLTSVFGF